MKNQNEIKHSQKFLRTRRLVLLLPVMVLPFLTFAGYAVGIIGGSKPETTTDVQGFNINLPDAHPPADSGWSKLKFYEKADEDSARRLNAVRSDPYYTSLASKELKSDTGLFSTSHFSYDPASVSRGRVVEQSEEKVFKKLAELDRQLNKPEPATAPADFKPWESAGGNVDVDRLEKMMSTVASNSGYPELNQINGLLEKILDVQHPERIKDKLKEQSLKENTMVYPVTREATRVYITSMGRQLEDTGINRARLNNSFYSLDEENTQGSGQSAIRAVIPNAQTLVNGATVEMMLSDDVYIAGVLIPRNSFVYGIASMGGERLRINITSIQYKNNLFPVALAVYDLDGMEGVYVPGAIGRDVSRQSTEQAIQSMGVTSLDPSFGAQAATAGITAAKDLIGKKTRVIRVNISKGYEILLFDGNRR